MTVKNVQVNHTVETKGAALPADFTADGTQILLNRCSGKGNHLFYFITLNAVTGRMSFELRFFRRRPHPTTCALGHGPAVDNCHVSSGGIDLMDRGIMESGHRWTMGWAALWNCTTKSFVVQQPPGSANWAIGCVGKQEHFARPGGKIVPPQEVIDSENQRSHQKALIWNSCATDLAMKPY